MKNQYKTTCGQCANNNLGTCERSGEMVRDTDSCMLGKTREDVVNHPSHYTNGSIECIDAMVSAFGKDAVETYSVINAFKYIWRHQHKNGTEDIEKAIWYLNKYLDLMRNS